jgi:hypothetical protein
VVFPYFVICWQMNSGAFTLLARKEKKSWKRLLPL